jgi:hypothetical protein
MTDDNAKPAPGWVAQLGPAGADFGDWERNLKPPFDPHVERIPMNGEVMWVLRSSLFDGLADAVEVSGRAIPLIDQLNGALTVHGADQPLSLRGVGMFGENGSFSATVLAEANIRAVAAATVLVTAEVRNAAGDLVPPAPPQVSDVQRWAKAAEDNDDIADLLRYSGRTGDWVEIYKAIEMAETLVGGEHQLSLLLGQPARACKNMKGTANFYRHARSSYKPDTTLDEAKPLLSFIVRTVLGKLLP